MKQPNLDNYSAQKIQAAQLLATKDQNDMTNAQIALEVGIDQRTLYRWQADPEFLELLNWYADMAQDAFIPELYSHLRKAVRSGSTRAMELALKNRGKLIDRREVSGSIEMGVKQIESKSQEELLAEVEELKRKVLEAARPHLNPPIIIEGEKVGEE